MGRPAAVGVFYWDSGEVPARPPGLGGGRAGLGGRCYEPEAVGVCEAGTKSMALTKKEAI